MKKKVLFLITKSVWGGAQRYVYDLATSLPADQFEVVVALGGDGPLKEKLSAAGIRTISIPGLQRDVSLKAELKASREIYRIIKTERPGVLHLNSSKAGAIGALLGRLARVPRIVFTAHGWAFNEDRSAVSKFLIGSIHWLTVFLCHHTIAVSEGMKRQLRGPFVQYKMTVVHPGRTVNETKNREAARREIFDFAPALQGHHTDFWLGTIAELHPIKRLHRAIDAVQHLAKSHPNLRYVIIGDGELRDKLQDQIKNLSLENTVFLTGAIPEAGRVLQAFDLFTLPSKSESYGYVLVEAGLAGLAVVSTATGGITDLVTHEENGLLVPTDDTEALTKALAYLLENEADRHRLAHTNQQRMLTKTVTQMTKDTIAVYNQ